MGIRVFGARGQAVEQDRDGTCPFSNGRCGWKLHPVRIGLLFQPHFEAPQTNDGTWGQHAFGDLLPIHKGPVARAEVSHEDRARLHHDFAVETGDGRVAQPKIVGWVPADRIEPLLQLKTQRLC